jgi:hypothetical protein
VLGRVLDTPFSASYAEDMRATVQLDDDVYELARKLASREKLSLGKVLSNLARRAIESAPTFARQNGFPVFEVRPETPPLTEEMVKRALEEG